MLHFLCPWLIRDFVQAGPNCHLTPIFVHGTLCKSSSWLLSWLRHLGPPPHPASKEVCQVALTQRMERNGQSAGEELRKWGSGWNHALSPSWLLPSTASPSGQCKGDRALGSCWSGVQWWLLSCPSSWLRESRPFQLPVGVWHFLRVHFLAVSLSLGGKGSLQEWLVWGWQPGSRP